MYYTKMVPNSLPDGLRKPMDNVVKTANHIKYNNLCCGLYAFVCEAMVCDFNFGRIGVYAP